NPTQLFVNAFREALARKGIFVSGEAVDIDTLVRRPDLSSAETWVTDQSAPLWEIVDVLQKFSRNDYAGNFAEALEAGFAAAGNGKSTANFDIAPTVPVIVGDDLPNCWMQVKPFLALYIGGMGAKSKNFYYNLACRYGYEEAADSIQAAYLTGDKVAAMFAVPDELVDAVALCGPRARIADRLQLWKDSPITTLNINADSIETVRMMAELVL
nr:LLM class flavin-dependent oxidoreductase [Caldilineaceae bacterium]